VPLSTPKTKSLKQFIADDHKPTVFGAAGIGLPATAITKLYRACVDATNNPQFRTSQTLQSPSHQMSARSSPQLVSADGKAKRGQGKPKVPNIFDARANSR
jgi:hypothetical protein